MNLFKKYPVAWFVILTVALSFATYFLPLPVEQRSLLVPVLMIFIPTIVSVPMALFTEGRDGIRQMLSTASLRRGGIKWLLVGALFLRSQLHRFHKLHYVPIFKL